jgi:putative CocE/NonD family hydrolase
MLLRLISSLALAASLFSATPEFDVRANYEKFEYRIPMRDGVKLFTIVYVPRGTTEKFPILFTRTPYGIEPYGPNAYAEKIGPSLKFEQDKFIFVSQDVRGRFESEGDFVDVPIIKDHLAGPTDTDVTTDTYDTIDWLIKNVPNNNGKVGMYGISYNGFYTSCALVRSHPALVAASPQAPMADLFKGDDADHNGAFFLIANFSFYTDFYKQNNPTLPEKRHKFDYGTKDGYQFYLQMGSLVDSDRKYLHFSNKYWTDMYVHTTYDDFWKPRNLLPHLNAVKPAVLVVGGWFDAEDLSGTLKTYRAIKSQSSATVASIVMGPWRHGGWNRTPGDKLGDIPFGAPTSLYYRNEIEFPFFRHYLKGNGAPAPAAQMFLTGRNVWKTLPQWPPANAAPQRLYLASDHHLSFNAPAETTGFDRYTSDPANPVPFFDGLTLTMNTEYMDADQRFVAKRPDVLTYVSEPLTEDLTIAGPVSPTLFVSTTGTDSDFDVKLVDVYPEDAPGKLSGYQQLVRGEPFRGKFRNSFEVPEPFKPGETAKIHFEMPDVYHCFLKGHRIMVQVQSSWFPLTDRNPQTFTEIPNAMPEQFVPATQRVYHSSFVELNVER